MNEKQTALVTGASSGFGEGIAAKLADAGFRVFGTSRNPRARQDGGTVEMLELDVVSEDSVRACVAAATDRAGGIDVLVNNAGRAHGSLLEETALDDAREIFETNFWGPVRLIEAVLPGMRERGGGLVVNVSSISGLVGAPGQGFYAASKHALEGYTEALRVEIGHLPVEVCLIEPGFFRTNLEEAKIRTTREIADYDAIRSRVESTVDEKSAAAGDPGTVAEEVAKLVESRGRRLRTIVGADAVRIARLKRWLPESLFMGGFRRYFGLDGEGREGASREFVGGGRRRTEKGERTTDTP